MDQNKNGLKLTSAAPMEDKLKKYNVLYIVFFAIGCIVGIVTNTPNWFILGAIFLFPAALVKSAIATKLVLNLQRISFITALKLFGQEMAGLIAIPLTQLGMTVTEDGCEAVVTYKGMLYYIRNYDDGTFGLIFDHSLGLRLIGGHRYISQYKKAIVAMPLIAYTIQQEIGKKEVENRRVEEGGNI